MVLEPHVTRCSQGDVIAGCVPKMLKHKMNEDVQVDKSGNPGIVRVRAEEFDQRCRVEVGDSELQVGQKRDIERSWS